MQGSTIEEVGDRFDGDLLGDDPVARARAAAAEATAAVAERLPRGGTVHLSYGEEQLDEYVYQLAADHLVHGWDLAVATGADAAFDPELVDAIAGWYAEREELYRSAGAVGGATRGLWGRRAVPADRCVRAGSRVGTRGRLVAALRQGLGRLLVLGQGLIVGVHQL